MFRLPSTHEKKARFDFGSKAAKSTPLPMGTLVNNFPGTRIHDHHLRFASATDEQTVRYGVVSEACRSLCNADWISLLDGQGLRIESQYLGGVFQVDVDQAVTSNHSLLCVALHIYRAHHIPRRRINNRNVVCPVIIREYTLAFRFVVDTVRSLSDIYFLDELQTGGIEKRDLVLSSIACKTSLQSTCNPNPMHPRCIGYASDHLSGVRVEHLYLRRMRNIQAAGLFINRHIVPAADARHWIARHRVIVCRRR